MKALAFSSEAPPEALAVSPAVLVVAQAVSASALAKVALEWMLREAQAEGLATIAEREARIMGRAGGNYVAPDPTATIHDELKHWNWWPAQLFPKKHWQRRIVDGKEVWSQRRKVNLAGWRTIPPGAQIHESAYARDPAYVAKLPKDAIRVTTLAAPSTDPRYSKETKKARA